VIKKVTSSWNPLLIWKNWDLFVTYHAARNFPETEIKLTYVLKLWYNLHMYVVVWRAHHVIRDHISRLERILIRARLSSSSTASSQVFCILLTDVHANIVNFRANLNECWSAAFFERYARQVCRIWEWSKKFWNSNTISMMIVSFAYFLHEETCFDEKNSKKRSIRSGKYKCS
jgi:hypothetical protein